MQINTVFLTVTTSSHSVLVEWWTNALGRTFDRVPVPSCREWDLTEDVFFQVIDAPQTANKIEVSVRIDGLDHEQQRMLKAGIEISEPTFVPGFKNLRWAKAFDPDGNTLNLLEGE